MESEASYPYCSGNRSCSPCAPSSWNYTICSEFIPKECKLHDSCPYKLDRSKFVAGLKVKERTWLNEVTEYCDAVSNIRAPVNWLAVNTQRPQDIAG